MLRSIFGVSLYMQRVAILAWGLSLGVLGLFMVALFPSMGDSGALADTFNDMPEEIIALLGGEMDFASIEGWLYLEMFGLLVPVAMIVYGVMRAGALLPGEERKGLLDFVLANPVSRPRIVLEKAAALLVGLVGIGFLLWVGIIIGALAVGVVIDPWKVAMAVLASVLLGAAFGGIAMFVGSLSGQTGAAAAVAATFGLVAYIVNSFYPLLSWMEPLRYVSPLYYYDASRPLFNGLSLAHAGVLAALAVAFVALAVALFQSKDMGITRFGLTLRLPGLPTRTAGRGVVRSVFGLAFRGQLALVVIWGISAAALGLMIMLFYPFFGESDELQQLFDSMPEEFLALLGGYNLDTAATFLSGETFGATVPIMFLIYGAMRGSAILTGEEERGLLDLLLANPISRTQVLLEKAGALFLGLLIIGASLWAGIAVGVLVADIEIDLVKVAMTCGGGVFLGMVFGSATMLAGTVIGRAGAAAALVAAVGVLAYVVNAFYPLIGWLEPLRYLSPMYYYEGNDPLVNGWSLVPVAVLAAIAVGFVTIAVATFRRRDLAV